jgi:hypothetical protein
MTTALSPITASLLNAQLSGTSTLPAVTHQAAWALLRNLPGNKLLGMLVMRDDAPADLVEQYRRAVHPAIRARYLSRAQHTADSLRHELAGENQASVLSQYLTSDAPDLLVQAVGEKLLVHPTVALATALTSFHRRLPAPVRLQILTLLHHRYPKLPRPARFYLNQLMTGLFDDQAVDQQTAASIVAENPDLCLPMFMASGVSEQTRHRMLDTAAASGNLTVAIKGLLTLDDLQPSVLDRSEQLAAAMPPGFDRDDILADLTFVKTPKALPPAGPVMTLPERLQAAATRADVALTVILDDTVPLNDRLRVAEDSDGFAGAAGQLARLPEPLQDLFMLRHPQRAVKHGGWGVYSDPLAAQVRVLAAAHATGKDSPLAGVLSAGIDQAAVRTVGWQALAAVAGTFTYDDRRQAIVDLITAGQADVLGDDPAAWEVFAVLCGEFNGTFGELLDACAGTVRR